MSLVDITHEKRGIDNELEPEHVLACLASAAEAIALIVDAVTTELNEVETNNASRRRDRRAA